MDMVAVEIQSPRHTPGPWRQCRHDPERIEGSSGCDGDTIAIIQWPNTAANARLIAASPDLLAALKTFVDRYKSLVDSGDCGFWKAEDEPHVAAALAAIAKAEGR